MFSTPFQAPCDHHVYITMFKMDGLGLAEHKHWGMSVKSFQLVLEYSETLKTKSVKGSEATQKLCFGVIWLI